MSLKNQIFWTFVVGYFLSSLAAYSLVGIPLEWAASLLFLFFVAFVFLHEKIPLVPGATFFILLFSWTVIITLVNLIVAADPSALPAMSTTGYLPYVFLRFLNIIIFAGVAFLAYHFLKLSEEQALLEAIVNVGVVAAIFALYIYVAQLYGLPEPTRTRMGTSGGTQMTHFNYAFHRALGTFREPSHLAQWLIVPMGLSLCVQKRMLNWKSLLMGAALILTGSLTGFMGALIGFICALLLVPKANKNYLSKVTKALLPILAASLVASVLVSSGGGNGAGILDTVYDRIEPILSGGGADETNRNYVYEYIETQDVSWFGDGLGQANLSFGQALGIKVTPSFLSLYINFLFSTGIIGLIMLMIFLLFPIVNYIRLRNKVKHKNIVYFLTIYIAWLIMYAVHAEELSIGFAISYALLVYATKFSVAENDELKAAS